MPRPSTVSTKGLSATALGHQCFLNCWCCVLRLISNCVLSGYLHVIISWLTQYLECMNYHTLPLQCTVSQWMTCYLICRYPHMHFFCMSGTAQSLAGSRSEKISLSSVVDEYKSRLSIAFTDLFEILFLFWLQSGARFTNNPLTVCIFSCEKSKTAVSTYIPSRYPYHAPGIGVFKP